MAREAHVVDVHVGIVRLGHRDGLRAESEVVDAVVGLRDGEERFAVVAFEADHERDAAVVEEHGAGIEGRVDAQALQQERVRAAVEVVAPLQRRVVAGDDGVQVAGVEPVVERGIRRVGAAEEGLVVAAKGGEGGVEVEGRGHRGVRLAFGAAAQGGPVG